MQIMSNANFGATCLEFYPLKFGATFPSTTTITAKSLVNLNSSFRQTFLKFSEQVAVPIGN